MPVMIPSGVPAAAPERRAAGRLDPSSIAKSPDSIGGRHRSIRLRTQRQTCCLRVVGPVRRLRSGRQVRHPSSIQTRRRSSAASGMSEPAACTHGWPRQRDRPSYCHWNARAQTSRAQPARLRLGIPRSGIPKLGMLRTLQTFAHLALPLIAAAVGESGGLGAAADAAVCAAIIPDLSWRYEQGRGVRDRIAKEGTAHRLFV